MMDSGSGTGMTKESVQYGSTKNRRRKGELWECGELRGNEKGHRREQCVLSPMPYVQGDLCPDEGVPL